MRTSIISLLLFCSSLSGAFAQEVKNVIFMIGDGMGLSQMYAGMTGNGGKLNMEQAQFTGIQKTFSESDYTTDSAAGGTALACGAKTSNGTIGMTADKKPLESILELAGKNGLSTGIVVTASVTDATPASYAAHQPSRKMQEEIAADMANAKLDVLIGGGSKYFSKRNDEKNLVKEMQEKGKTVVFTLEEAIQSSKTPLVALLAEDHLPAVTKGRGDMLAQGTKKALEVLSKNKKGFFLMVEGSHIDKVSHSNDAEALTQEVIDFDKAVGAAISFARKNENTLVIVAADHETGGMSIMKGSFANKEVTLKFATTEHTGVPVIVYSYGPGAKNFTGVFDNTVYKEKIAKLMGLKEKK